MTRTYRRLALALPLALLAASPAVAAIPQVLTYTGYLKTAAGAPVTAATDLTFRLYPGAADLVPLWAEQVSVVPSSDGWFSAVLGTSSPIPAGLTGAPLYLSLQVGTDAEFAQRLRVTPSPAALAVDWSGVQGKPDCADGQFLTQDAGGALVCAAPPSGGLTAVQVGAGLTGQGTAASPLALVLGPGGAQAALDFGGSSFCPAGTVVNGANPATGAVSCTPVVGQVASVTAAARAGNPVLVSGGADVTIDMDPARVLPACADGQLARSLSGAWVCGNEATFSGVVVDGTLSGDGLAGTPLSVRLGPGLVAGGQGVAVDAGPGLLLLPGTGQLAVDLPAGGAQAGTSTQVARADHRHRGAPAIQLKPSDFVEFPGAGTPVLGRLSLDANAIAFRVVPAMTMPPQSIAYAVAQFPAGVAAGTAATVHLSVAGETAGAPVTIYVVAGGFGPPGTSQEGNLSDFRQVDLVLPARGTSVVTLNGVMFYPRYTQAGSVVEGAPAPGDLLLFRVDNGNLAGGATYHLVGAQITFDTP